MSLKPKALLASLFACFCSLAMAETVFVEATQDNTLYDSPTGRLSNGMGEHMFVGLTLDQLRRRSVIAFKNLSAIPEGVTVTSVKLHVHVSLEDSDATLIDLSRLTSDWGEGDSDAAGDETEGANSEPDDATWAHRFWDLFTWDNPGGDFSETPSEQLLIDSPGYYTFGSNLSMVADVQEWLTQPETNFGWIMIGDERIRNFKRFDSRNHSNPDTRPVLEVQYTNTGTSFDYSGAWFDPALEGEGYLIFQTPQGWLIYFFGYGGEGEFRWLISELVKLDLLEFGEPFEMPMLVGKPGTFEMPAPSDDLTPYGTLSVTFNSCTTGLFVLDGLDGKKTSNVVKLVGVDNSVCKEP